MEGTDFVPHYPYVPVMGELLDEGIRVVTTRHERTAVAMADAYTRFSMGHKNGVAMTTVWQPISFSGRFQIDLQYIAEYPLFQLHTNTGYLHSSTEKNLPDHFYKRQEYFH